MVIDAGIATAENLAWLKANGFHYIVVQRSKGDFSADDTEAMHVIRDTNGCKLEVKRCDRDGEALRLCRSSGRVQKDRGIRGPPGAVTVEYNVKEQGRLVRNHLRRCSSAEPEHRLIYQRLNLNETPLPRKIATVT